MKKYTNALFLVALTVTLAGCSTGELASTETTEVPVEQSAGGEQFNSLANSDLTPAATDPGAVVDTATPNTVVASADTTPSEPASSYSAPQSPVNLGASSAGRAH